MMGENTKTIVALVVGTVIGSVVTWKLTSDKYERIMDEEIESVKRAFHEMESLREEQKFNELDESGGEAEDLQKYAEILDNNNYTEEKGGDVVKPKTSGPYIIPPDEFGEFYDYAEISLTYYNDGVLVDECDDVMSEDDIDEMIGSDFAMHFGEFEDDSVFIRNDERKVDYEILKDFRNYADVFPDAPKVTE